MISNYKYNFEFMNIDAFKFYLPYTIPGRIERINVKQYILCCRKLSIWEH